MIIVIITNNLTANNCITPNSSFAECLITIYFVIAVSLTGLTKKWKLLTLDPIKVQKGHAYFVRIIQHFLNYICSSISLKDMKKI